MTMQIRHEKTMENDNALHCRYAFEYRAPNSHLFGFEHSCNAATAHLIALAIGAERWGRVLLEVDW